MNKSMVSRLIMLSSMTCIAIFLVVGVKPSASTTVAEAQCNDSLKNCKNAKFVGKNGNCSCFSCETPDRDHLTVLCTTDPKNKLTLFDNEANERKSAVQFDRLSNDTLKRLRELGIRDVPER